MGVIFVSIDDNEVHSLRLLMDEIFGAENFLACSSGKQRDPDAETDGVSIDHEYVLTFAKQKNAALLGNEMKQST